MTKFAQDLTEAREIYSVYEADSEPESLAIADELLGNYRALERAVKASERYCESDEEEYEPLDDES